MTSRDTTAFADLVRIIDLTIDTLFERHLSKVESLDGTSILAPLAELFRSKGKDEAERIGNIVTELLETIARNMSSAQYTATEMVAQVDEKLPKVDGDHPANKLRKILLELISATTEV